MPRATWITFQNKLMAVQHPNPPDVFKKEIEKKSQSMFCTHIKMNILSLLWREKYLAAQMII